MSDRQEDDEGRGVALGALGRQFGFARSGQRGQASLTPAISVK